MTQQIRAPGQAMYRGALNRCPNCGQGKILSGYLKVVPECEVCGEPLGEYRAADGPAFFTITIVMLLLIPLMGFGWTLFRPDPLTLLIVLSIFVMLLTLILLRHVKGAFIGYLWAHEERDRGA